MGKDSLQNITCPLKAMKFQTLFKKTSFIYLLRRGPGYLWSFQDNSGCLADWKALQKHSVLPAQEAGQPTYIQAQIHLSNPLRSKSGQDQILHCHCRLKHLLWRNPDTKKTFLGLCNWGSGSYAQGSHLPGHEYMQKLQVWVSIRLSCLKTPRHIIWQDKVSIKVIIQLQVWNWKIPRVFENL